MIPMDQVNESSLSVVVIRFADRGSVSCYVCFPNHENGAATHGWRRSRRKCLFKQGTFSSVFVQYVYFLVVLRYYLGGVGM